MYSCTHAKASLHPSTFPFTCPSHAPPRAGLQCTSQPWSALWQSWHRAHSTFIDNSYLAPPNFQRWELQESLKIIKSNDYKISFFISTVPSSKKILSSYANTQAWHRQHCTCKRWVGIQTPFVAPSLVTLRPCHRADESHKASFICPMEEVDPDLIECITQCHMSSLCQGRT